MNQSTDNGAFGQFVEQAQRAVSDLESEQQVLRAVSTSLQSILGQSGWLPAAYVKPRDDRYAQYPLFVAPDGSLSVVSFVWLPGQWTPIHDHTVWGVVGIHQGLERTEAIEIVGGSVNVTKTIDATVGEVGAVSPTIGDIHRVGNVSDAVAVSIHVYGGDIGRISRHVYDESTGQASTFVSGYESVPPLLS